MWPRACALSLILVACTTGNSKQTAQLQAELRTERELLKETRAEMQAVIAQLEPMLALAKLIQEGPLPSLLAERPASEPTSGPDNTQDTGLAGITQVSEFETRITRSAAEGIFDDVASLMRGARIVPSMSNGKANGFKIYAIRPSSFFAKVGIRNGDTIHSINGMELSSPDQVMEAWNKLKAASGWELVLTRRGQPINLRIEIE